MLRLTDLREILRYIPQFRDRVFVIAIDGAIVADDNFTNLMLDIKLLRSLRIGVAIVHGAGLQIRQVAAREGLRLSNSDGTGITDPATLRVSVQAANNVSHHLLQGLADNDLRAAVANSIVAHPAGILGGIDQQWTGRVERIDTAVLKTLLDGDIIPIIPPLGFDGEGRTFRLNSDAVAVEVDHLDQIPGVVERLALARHMAEALYDEAGKGLVIAFVGGVEREIGHGALEVPGVEHAVHEPRAVVVFAVVVVS